MFISDSEKFIYFHIPKTAGSSIHECLKIHSGDISLDPLPPVHHMTSKEYLYFHPEKKDYFKFAFVRNPYSRIVSAYLDFKNQRASNFYEKLQKNLNYYKFNPFSVNTLYFSLGNNIKKEDYKNFYDYCNALAATNRENSTMLTINKRTSFKDFVENINSSKWILDVHFKSQYDFVYDNNDRKLVNFIGKYENLQKDIRKVSKEINIEFNLRRIRENKSYDYKNYYDDKTKKIVTKLFSKDLELFKYVY